MSRKITEILVHVDWVDRHGRLRYKYHKAVESPFIIGKNSRLIPPPNTLEEATVLNAPLFNERGFLDVVADIPKYGFYILCLRQRYRLEKLVVDPVEVVVDLLAESGIGMQYFFYNPTPRLAIHVTAQLVEDLDGVYRKILADPSDLTWRQSFVRRAMASEDDAELESSRSSSPEIMTGEQVARYLGVAAKTIRNWTSQGTIPYKRVGGSPRYRKKDIDEMMAVNRLGGRAKGRTKK